MEQRALGHGGSCGQASRGPPPASRSPSPFCRTSWIGATPPSLSCGDSGRRSGTPAKQPSSGAVYPRQWSGIPAPQPLLQLTNTGFGVLDPGFSTNAGAQFSVGADAFALEGGDGQSRLRGRTKAHSCSAQPGYRPSAGAVALQTTIGAFLQMGTVSNCPSRSRSPRSPPHPSLKPPTIIWPAILSDNSSL